ncbi:MAG: DUF1844 domain-containing protein [Syntrophales bacterium]|nr:DUF1844 domain-containing protein [Syntrophales bacterium]
MEEDKKGFVVKDRRILTESGELKEEAKSKSQEEDQQREKVEGAAEEEKDQHFPEVTFSNFILSLSTTAMYHFGDFTDATGKASQRNLAAAKHIIDTLAMLKEKTEGNLESNEKHLLDDLLFELRMRYVRETSKK